MLNYDANVPIPNPKKTQFETRLRELELPHNFPQKSNFDQLLVCIKAANLNPEHSKGLNALMVWVSRSFYQL